MDNFIDVLYRVMNRREARELYENGREYRAAEQEAYKEREDNYRRTREIRHDFDYDVFRTTGGLKI